MEETENAKWCVFKVPQFITLVWKIGYVIPTNQMQYDAADKEMDQKDNLLIAEYILEGTVLQNVCKIKQLGVPVTEDLRWN